MSNVQTIGGHWLNSDRTMVEQPVRLPPLTAQHSGASSTEQAGWSPAHSAGIHRLMPSAEIQHSSAVLANGNAPCTRICTARTAYAYLSLVTQHKHKCCLCIQPDTAAHRIALAWERFQQALITTQCWQALRRPINAEQLRRSAKRSRGNM